MVQFPTGRYLPPLSNVALLQEASKQTTRNTHIYSRLADWQVRGKGRRCLRGEVCGLDRSGHAHAAIGRLAPAMSETAPTLPSRTLSTTLVPTYLKMKMRGTENILGTRLALDFVECALRMCTSVTCTDQAMFCRPDEANSLVGCALVSLPEGPNRSRPMAPARHTEQSYHLASL